MKEEDYQPIAYKVGGKFLSKLDVREKIHKDFSQHLIYDGIPYWDNDTLQSLIDYRQSHLNEQITRPEHCDYRNEINGKFINYVDNALNPYVRLTHKAMLDGYHLLVSGDGCTYEPDEKEDVSKYPIIGYGFCAYLSVHSTLNGNRVDFKTYQQRCGIGTLFNSYYTDRYNLYKAIHSDEYQSLIAKSQDEWGKNIANQELKGLDKTFISQFIEQEQANITKSAALLSLFDGKLNRYVGEDYFLKFVKGKLNTEVSNDKEHRKQKTSFKDIIQYKDKDKLIVRLHELIDGKGGKNVGVVLVRAKFIDKYLSRYPSQAEYQSVFKLIGTWQAISNYFYKEEDNNVLTSANDIVIF